MTVNDLHSNPQTDLEDDYLSRSRELVDQFLEEHGFTHEFLQSLPTEEAHALIRQALDFAAERMARIEMMVRLGSRDIGIKAEDLPHKRHTDRFERYFKGRNKS